jgi:very-short-patch-repair endonuclease
MRARHWEGVAAIAREQDGLITYRQALGVGTSRSSFEREVRFGRLALVRRRVYRVAALPEGPHIAIRAAVLANPRLIASHTSAASLWRLYPTGFPVHCTIAPGRKARLAGVVVHQAPVRNDELTDVWGIMCTTPARAIVDLATVLPAAWVERLLHDAVMRGLCQYDEVRAVADRRRSVVVRSMVEGASGTTPLEVRWYRLLRDAGVPEPVSQYQVVVDGSVFVLDFAWPEERVALEVDGFVAHRTRAAFDRDRAKVIALKSAGWEVVAVSAKTPPDPVLALLRRLISQKTFNS